MVRLYVPAALLAPGTSEVTVEGDAHRYVGRVLRMKVGDSCVIFDGEGGEIDAKLTAITSTFAQLRLGERRKREPARVRITLVQGVAKGERMDWVLQKTTELGVARIVPVTTSRVVVRLDAKGVTTKHRRWQIIVQEAARQCGRADVPTVEPPAPLGVALAALPAAARFVLWEEPGGQPMVQSLDSLSRLHAGAEVVEVQLFVGPEGGLSEDEVALARTHDFVPVSLGTRVLRTETAAVVAVTLAQAALGGFV